jgi:hypothetical protein
MSNSQPVSVGNSVKIKSRHNILIAQAKAVWIAVKLLDPEQRARLRQYRDSNKNKKFREEYLASQKRHQQYLNNQKKLNNTPRHKLTNTLRTHNIIYDLNKAKNSIYTIKRSNSTPKNIIPSLNNVSNSIQEAEEYLKEIQGLEKYLKEVEGGQRRSKHRSHHRKRYTRKK